MEGLASGRIPSWNLETGQHCAGSYDNSCNGREVESLYMGNNDELCSIRTFLTSRRPMNEKGLPGSCTGNREYPLVRLRSQNERT